MPFNWKTPIGYLVTLSIEAVATYYVTVFLSLQFCFLIVSCVLLKSFVDDIMNELHTLNVDKQIPADSDDAKNLKLDLCNVVQDHANMKELVEFFSIYFNFI